jgi:methionyl-tRNA formyltransferase
MVTDALCDGLRSLPEPVPQHGEVTIAEKITKEDLHLDWRQPAVQLARVVRLGHAWTTFRGRRLGVLDAAVAPRDAGAGGVAPGAVVGAAVATADGVLVLRRVQPESRSPMSAEEWLRGVRPAPGERLGTD